MHRQTRPTRSSSSSIAIGGPASPVVSTWLAPRPTPLRAALPPGVRTRDGKQDGPRDDVDVTVVAEVDVGATSTSPAKPSACGNLSYGRVVTPNSGKVRVVPMVDDVAQRLARLADRDLQTADEDAVLASPLGGHLDPSALRRRFVDATRRAELRTPTPCATSSPPGPSTRPHSSKSRHGWATPTSRTTARYLHHRAQHTDAALLADAFRPATASAPANANRH
jgi:hypothetical protein